MKRAGSGLLVLIFCGCLDGCGSGRVMQDIAQVIYTSDAGPILPELQWHEQLTINPAGASLTRTGRAPETDVNAGTWEFALDEAAVAALFARLGAVDCAALRRIEPDDEPDGGGSERYVIRHVNNRQCVLAYDPGVSYTGGETVVGPITDFIRALPLPAEAANRYK